MKESEIIKNLDDLAKVRELLKSYQQDLDELVDQAFLSCPDLATRRRELSIGQAMIVEKSVNLTKAVTNVILENGASVAGKTLHAVFSKGRTTWDTQKLEGYAIAHPELKELKKVGKPSVSIREVKDKEKL